VAGRLRATCIAILLLGLGAGAATGHLAWPTGLDPARAAAALRAEALARGILSLDGAAVALLADPGPPPLRGLPPADRARLAVELAPELPAAHFALAAASEGAERGHALLRGLRELVRHPEAKLWVALVAVWAAVGAGLAAGGTVLGCLLLRTVRHAVHDLGDALGVEVPAYARGALLGGSLLLPLVLGGGAGALLAIVLAAVVFYGDARDRTAAVLAAVLLAAATGPLLDAAFRLSQAPRSDPGVLAAVVPRRAASLRGELEPLQQAAAAGRVDAAVALALHARRMGRVELARELLDDLVASGATERALLQNAANARVATGDPSAAFELYDRLLEHGPDAVVLFDLSQALGREIRIHEQERALAHAQVLDPETVGELTRLDGVSPVPLLVDRSPGSVVGAALQSSPGAGWTTRAVRSRWLGSALSGSGGLAGVLAGAAVLALFLAAAFPPSRTCGRCARSICPRCHGPLRAGLCRPCASLFGRRGDTDRSLRRRALAELRRRRQWISRIQLWVGLVVPGGAGLLAGSPGLAVAAPALVGAAAVLVGSGGELAAPAAVGPAGGGLRAGAGVLALALAAGLTLAALRRLRGQG